MSSTFAVDEDLIRRLPMPLAQLYHSAHSHKTAVQRCSAAYYLWEGALKLLGCTAVVAYAQAGRPGPARDELTQLLQPSVGHWWEFVRLLVPALADAGDDAFGAVRGALLGEESKTWPFAAGLDVALRRHLEGVDVQPRSTVRPRELFDRLVVVLAAGLVGL
jgi:hypothetical protein